MKWLSLIALLAATFSLVRVMRSRPRAVQIACLALGFSPFILGDLHLTMAFVSWSDWPGFVTGAEFSVVDALTLSLYFSLPRVQHPLPFRISFALYLFATLLSALQAFAPIASLFYSWQLARMFLVYVVIIRVCARPLHLSALLKGMSAGLFLEAIVAFWERFGLGLLQAPGTFGHQNTLGMVTHFSVFPFFALLLSGRVGWLPFLVLPAGIIIELLTTSRATIGLALLGYSVVFVLSAVRSWTSRKAITLVVAIAMGAVVAPVALSAIASRGSVEGSDEERVALESAASMMLSDHPLGVGANNFVIAANTQGYYQRAGVGWYSYGAIVHNVYRLVAAETGYFGLIVFAMFLLNPMIAAIWCGLRNPKDVRGDLLIGLGAALLVEYLHNLVEWVFVTDPLQYPFAMDIGLVAGLAIQLGYWRQKRAKSPFSLSKSGPAQGSAALRREVAPRSGTAVGGS